HARSEHDPEVPRRDGHVWRGAFHGGAGLLERRMLRFLILGPLEIWGDDGEIRINSPRNRLLLALLLLAANRVVSTDQLKDVFWGERPPPAAGASLQNGIGALRKVLGAESIEQRPPGYVLHVAPEQLDLAHFEGLCKRARAEGPLERAATLREALAL